METNKSMENRRSKFFGFPVVFESHRSKTFEVTCGQDINQIAPRLLLLLSIGSSRSWTLSIPACCWIRTLSLSYAIAETKQIRNCFFRGSGGSTAVGCRPHDREVLGSNPSGCWTFFSSLSHQWCVLNSGPSRRCNSTDFPIKNKRMLGCAKQAY